MDDQKIAELEALLFISGEPIKIDKIVQLLNLKEERVHKVINALDQELISNPKRGLFLIKSKDRIQLSTKPEVAHVLGDFIKAEFKEELTPAALEVLSIVAYLGPISRARIEYIRGVNSIFTLRQLMIRGLVEQIADSKNSQVFLYQPTFQFWRQIGVNQQSNLPEYAKFRSILDNLDLNSSNKS